MKEFNLAKSLNYAVSQPTVKPRENKVDENRPNFAYLKTSELVKGEKYPVRPLPPHPERNPLGYVIKEMYQFPESLDMESKYLPKHKNKFVMVPGCYKADADDYMLGVYKRLNALVDGPTNYDFLPTDDEGNGDFVLKDGCYTITRADEFRNLLNSDPEFRMFIKVISSKWTQVIVPVILYATCDVKKTEQAYDRFSNYQPDVDLESGLPRLLQFNISKDLQTDFLDNFRDKTTDKKDKNYWPWNDAEKGQVFNYTRKDKGHTFAPMGAPSEFDEVWAGKMAQNPDYYPDVVSRELKRSFAPDTIEAALKNCPAKYLKPLIDFGVLDTE